MRVEVCRVGDNPVAILVGVNVPTFVIMPQHVLGLDLLSVEHLFTRLHFHVVSDSLLAAWAEHHKRAEGMLRNGRRDRAFVLELSLLLFLSDAVPKGEAVFNLG